MTDIKEWRVDYGMSLPHSLMHKIITIAKDTGNTRSALIEQLISIGLKVYMDPEINTANKPVRSVRDVVVDTAKTVAGIEDRLDRLESRRGIGPH